MKKIFTFLFLALASGSHAQDSKINVKVGGIVETKLYYNTYRSRTAREGVQYAYPLAPDYDGNGRDRNREGFLGFSVAPSRLNVRATGPDLGRAAISGFIECDFMGTGDDLLQSLRMRHAFIQLDWQGNSILTGQTNHLTAVDEVTPNTVSFGAGVPLNAMNRSVQFRYVHRFNPQVSFLAAAHIYNFNRSVGPALAQNKAGIPDVQLQMKFGDKNNVFGGFTVGYRFLKPRSEDENGNKINRLVGSYNISAFFKAILDGYSVKLWGIYGENLSHLSMVGGYGRKAGDAYIADYAYENTRTLSFWTDLESPVYQGKWQIGLFGGYQENLGTAGALYTDAYGNFTGHFKDTGLRNFYRISPRVVYFFNRHFTLGFEYMFSSALWGKTFDHYYRSTEDYNRVSDHRFEASAKFVF